MLSVTIEENPPSPALGSLWFPGKEPKTLLIAPMTERAQEISERREDLLRILRHLPESEYELSLTDLVEKESPPSTDAVPDKKKTSLTILMQSPADQEDSNQPAGSLKETRNQKTRMRRWGSSSGGFLLNIYIPSSLTRSLTGSRSGRGSGRRTTSDGSRRDREPSPLVRCWPTIWN